MQSSPDLEYEIIILSEYFRDMKNSALHEINYGLDFFSEEDCGKLYQSYLEAYEICSKFLIDKDIRNLVHGLAKLKMANHLSHLMYYIPDDLRDEILSDS